MHLPLFLQGFCLSCSSHGIFVSVSPLSGREWRIFFLLPPFLPYNNFRLIPFCSHFRKCGVITDRGKTPRAWDIQATTAFGLVVDVLASWVPGWGDTHYSCPSPDFMAPRFTTLVLAFTQSSNLEETVYLGMSGFSLIVKLGMQDKEKMYIFFYILYPWLLKILIFNLNFLFILSLPTIGRIFNLVSWKEG